MAKDKFGSLIVESEREELLNFCELSWNLLTNPTFFGNYGKIVSRFILTFFKIFVQAISRNGKMNLGLLTQIALKDKVIQLLY